MNAALDANVVLRHLTGTPPDLAARATAFLERAKPGTLLLLDVQLAEVVYVLDTVYERDRSEVATAILAVLATAAVSAEHEAIARRTVELYAQRRMDWPDAYLVAAAEERRLPAVVSFDRFDARTRDLGVRRDEP
jgi:predicted nucleic-acid-binding protein